MPTAFQTSQYSPGQALGDAGGRIDPIASSVKVQDVPGDFFIVHGNGTIEIVKTGKVYSTATDPGASMIKFLYDRAGNKAKIEAVLGVKASTALAAAQLPVPVSISAVQAAQQAEAAGVGDPPVSGGGLTSKVWFWPVVILSVVAVGGGIALYMTKGRGGTSEVPA
jgi:hypothetical protein